MSRHRVLLFLVALLTAAPLMVVGQTCDLPVTSDPATQANIFTAEQAAQFGDILAERYARGLRVVTDDKLNAGLQRIGDRLLEQSRTDFPVHFVLSDLPFANAFTYPGGRVYVTRKMVAFVRNEDELAAVLAHEVGHVVVHDPEIGASRLFRKVLGITELGDRNDVYRRYNELLDNVARKHLGIKRKEEEKHQVGADQVAIWVLARAGYRPDAFVEFWDRFTETNSDTGNWLSDFFGTTKPESKRLREALKTVSSLPPSCINHQELRSPEFYAWQQAVIAGPNRQRAEALHDVVSRRALEPALRPDLLHSGSALTASGSWRRMKPASTCLRASPSP